jgi:hypothetical protein
MLLEKVTGENVSRQLAVVIDQMFIPHRLSRKKIPERQPELLGDSMKQKPPILRFF